MASLKYSEDHEWVMDQGDGTATIGITDFAQAQLGDLVYIESSEEGQQIQQGETICAIESVKAASDLIAPISGTIVDVNSDLEEEPEKVNESPMDTWFIRVKISDSSEIDALMDEQDYLDLIAP